MTKSVDVLLPSNDKRRNHLRFIICLLVRVPDDPMDSELLKDPPVRRGFGDREGGGWSERYLAPGI